MPWLLLLLSLLLVTHASADDLGSPSAELELEPDLELAEPDPTEGYGVAALGAELNFVDQGGGDRNRDVTGGAGFHLQLLGSRLAWPVMVGLGFGNITFNDLRELRVGRAADTRHSHPEPLDWSDSSSLQIRHVELVTRYQPLWGPVRPYAELAVGLAAFWNPGAAQQRFVSVLYTAVLGIDWRLHTYSPGSDGTWSLTLTTAIKRVGTGPIERPTFAVVDGANGRAYAEGFTREVLGMWTPYLGLALAIDSRHSSRARPRERPLPRE